MKAGDVVLSRFPRTDLQTGKMRPALILAVMPGRHKDILLAFITSQTHQAIADFDEVIDPADSDYSKTGLKARSVVRISRLATVEASVINGRIGRISQSRLKEIRNRLADWLKTQKLAGT